MFSALAFNHGDLNSKLDLFIACAPIINLRNSPNTMMQEAAAIWKPLEGTMEKFGFYAVGSNPSQQKSMETFCKIFGWLCTTIKNFANIGASPWNDPTTSAIVDARVGSWASLKQIVHYGQIFKTGIFKDYDYGSDKNNVAFTETESSQRFQSTVSLKFQLPSLSVDTTI